MRNPLLVAGGVVVFGLGLLFFLQGINVLKGSGMSNTTTWSVAGPIIAIIGLAVAAAGARPRSHALDE